MGRAIAEAIGAQFAESVGAANVLTDPAKRTFFSTDLAGGGKQTGAVIQIGSVEELARVAALVLPGCSWPTLNGSAGDQACRRDHPHRLVANVDSTLEQQVFDVAQRQWETHVHHHNQADHLRRRIEVTKRGCRPCSGFAGHGRPLAALGRPCQSGLTKPLKLWPGILLHASAA